MSPGLALSDVRAAVLSKIKLIDDKAKLVLHIRTSALYMSRYQRISKDASTTRLECLSIL